MNKIIIILLLLTTTTVANAQQGFGTNTPAASAVVDMTIAAANKGVLIPRVALNSTTDGSSPISSPAAYLLVFNTVSAGSGATAVTRGFYYWSGTAWVRLLNPGDNPGSEWNLTGNAGTNPPTIFVGTTDAQDFVLKTNAAERMRMMNATGAIGIGTASPATPALLDVTSTALGFLPPRMTSDQMAAISSPAEGLIVFNTTLHCLAYYAKGAFTCASVGAQECGQPMTFTHIAGPVAPVNKTVTYGTVRTNIGGTGYKCWITQNLGADNQASSATDATEAAAGWCWQFNRLQGYKSVSGTLTPTNWNSINDNLSATWEAAKDPCTQLLGIGWRIPTSTEWTNADAAPQNWNNYTDTYNSVLKIHAAGYLKNTDGSLLVRGIHGIYWSSTQYSATYGYYLSLSSSISYVTNLDKAFGFSVRCLRD